MRWPWQKRPADPVEDEITDLMAEHRTVIRQVRQVLQAVNEDMGRTAHLMEGYERADRQRRDDPT